MALTDSLKGKKGTVFLIGGAGGLLLFLWYKHSQKASSAAPAATQAAGTASGATSGDPFPSDGTTGNPSDPYSVDPATGMTYGDEQAGYGGGFAGGGFGSGFTGGFPGGGNPPPGPGPGSFTSNAQWAQYVEQQLTFVDPATLSAAIGYYLSGLPVTTDQASLIDQANAIGGYPPVSGPGGYPPAIHIGSGGGGTQVPNVVGQNWMGAIHQLQAAGFKPSPSAKPHGAKDPITSQHPAAGANAAKGSTVTIKGR